MRRLRVILITLAPLVLAPTASTATVQQGTASVVSEYLVPLTGGAQTTFQTTGTSSGGDPVLHLLTYAGYQVAVNDNGGGGVNARLSYKPFKSGMYRLVVRSTASTTAGTTDVHKNGAAWLTGVRFGGWRIWLSSLRVGEAVRTVRLPNGGGPSHRLYILASDGLGIARRANANDVAGAAAVTITTAASRYAVVGVANGKGATGGAVRLLRNDAALSGHDPDKDGVGAELEAALGTCSALAGTVGSPEFDCSRAADARDTDGDGISDGWEIFGRGDGLPHQPLPLWGANPRHKDLFIEVDFMRRTVEENIANVDANMPDAVARKFAEVYGDAFTTSPLLRLYHAAVLRNPDRLPGVSVHIDTGRPPASASDATIFGNWGGHNAVDAICDSSGCSGSCDMSGEACVGPTAAAAWPTQMRWMRRGIFRYALAYRGGGGSAGEGFAASYNMDSAFNSAHETGHTMGLGHSGPLTGSQLEANCAANYPSLMSYSYDNVDVGFADGLGRAALNNTKLTEWQAVPTSNTRYLDDLELRFGYNIDRASGHVDWNRDGVFAPSGSTVRAYANLKQGGAGCEHTRWHQTRVPAAASHLAPAIARLGGRIYVFSAIWPGILRYVYSTSSWYCPLPNTSSCGSWVDWGDAPLPDGSSAVGGVDVTRITYGSVPVTRLLVVARGNDGRLWEARMSHDASGNPVWTGPAFIPGSSSAASEPALTSLGGRAYLVYRSTDGTLRFNRTGSSGTWLGDQPVLTPTGDPVSMADYASPAVSRATLAWRSGAQIYAALAGSDGRLDLYGFDQTTLRWENTGLTDARSGPIEGRPAMQWVPFQTGVDSPGRLYIVYIRRNTSDPTRREARLLFSYVRRDPSTGATTPLVGFDSPFDNVWFYSYGFDLLYDAGIDTSLRAAYSVGADYGGDNPDAPKRFQIWFRPNADGIYDYSYVNHDDWAVLRVGVCRYVVDPANEIPDDTQIKCPPKTW
jgi:hypothetical protein